MAFVEAPQKLEEVAAVPRQVKGPCLLNVVWRGKTPDVSLDDAQAMGYKLAILPALLFTEVICLCARLFRGLKHTRRHPVALKDITPREAFRRFGADEWDRISEQFRPEA